MSMKDSEVIGSAPKLAKTASNLSTASSVSSLESDSQQAIKRNPQDFEFGRILGEGSYSTVLLAKEPSRNKSYAVKVLDKVHIIRENKVKYVTIEKDVLNKLAKHPFIVRLYYTFQDSSSLYFVLEYCPNGDLLAFLKTKGRMSKKGAGFYIAEIAKGVEYIHSNLIIHRDIKPENILLDRKYHIKITDFGSAKILADPTASQSLEKEEDNASLKARRASFVGTAEYCSPELLNDSKATSLASDVWAIGCILYQLLVGIPPFKGTNEYQTFLKITKLEYTLPPSEQLDEDSRQLISQILVLDPEKRPKLTGSFFKDTFFNELQLENLHSQTPPIMEFLEPLLKAAEAGMDSLQYIDPEYGLGELSLDDKEEEDNDNDGDELDSWIPNLSLTDVDPSDVLFSGKVEITAIARGGATNSLSSTAKPRGLLLTSETLYIYHLKNEKITAKYPLTSTTFEYVKLDEFTITSSSTSNTSSTSTTSLSNDSETLLVQVPNEKAMLWIETILKFRDVLLANPSLISP